MRNSERVYLVVLYTLINVINTKELGRDSVIYTEPQAEKLNVGLHNKYYRFPRTVWDLWNLGSHKFIQIIPIRQ